MSETSGRTGLFYGLSCYILWGFFPLYFHQLNAVSPLEVLSHRVLWSFLFVGLVLWLLGMGRRVREVASNRKLWMGLLLSSVLIGINWLVFLWAVVDDQVLASSLGYFLTPLVSVLLARIFLKETLPAYRLAACALALMGIVWQIVQLGSLPWISIVLAVSFGLYGLVRKQLPVDTATGLLVETAMLIPFAIGYTLWIISQGSNQFAGDISTTFFMIGSGVVTAIPLLAFAAAAKRLSLSVLGFMMYINPTLQMLTAVFLFGEPFNEDQLISFAFTWVALAIFSLGAWRQGRKTEAALKSKS